MVNTSVFGGSGDDLLDDIPLKYTLPELTVVGVIMSIGSLLTIFGNISVVVIYLKTKSLQIAKNFYILSLAVNDVIIAGFSLNIYTVYILYGYWPFGHTFCYVWLIIDHWTCTISTLTLLAIAFDCFYAVFFPMSHRLKQTKVRVRNTIISIWIGSFLVFPVAILAYSHIVGQQTVPSDQCYIQFLFESWIMTFSTAFLSYYAPAVLTAVLYTSISIKLMKRFKAVKTEFVAATSTTPRVEGDEKPNDTSSDPIKTPSVCSQRPISETQNRSFLGIGTEKSSLKSTTTTTTTTTLTEGYRLSNSELATITKDDVNFSLCVSSLWLTSSKLRGFDTTRGKKSLNVSVSPSKAFNEQDCLKRKSFIETGNVSLCCYNRNSQKISKNSNEGVCYRGSSIVCHSQSSRNLKSRTLRKLKRFSPSNRIPRVSLSTEGCQRTLTTHKRAVKLLLLIIVAFAVSWMPYYVSIIVVATTKQRLPEPLWRFCYIIGWFNSLLNPLCYAFGNPKFNKGFRDILCGRKNF